MPAFNQKVKEAGSAPIPGTWRCKIEKSYQRGQDKVVPGVEVGRTKDNKHELWKCIAVVDDPTPGAPNGVQFFTQLTWDGAAGEGRIYKLLRVMGHPVDEWYKATTPVNVTPEMLHDRYFKHKSKIRTYTQKGTNGHPDEQREALEDDGFNCYLPLEAPSGPAPATPAGPAKGSGGKAPWSKPGAAAPGAAAGGTATPGAAQADW